MRPCRPACRLGRLDHALPRAVDQPRAAGAALRSLFPRPKAGRCCLPVLAVGFHSFGAAQVSVLVGVVVSHCAASAALQKRMAAGHPFMGRGGRLDRGNPEGVPRPQAALRRFVLLRRSSYPRFSAFQLQAIFIGKKKLEAPYRFRGGAISREKGVRFHVDNRPRGGAISRAGGVRFHVEKLAYPQGFSTGWACFGCFAVAFSLVTGRAPGRARLSPKVGGAISRPALVTPARWPARRGVAINMTRSAAGTA